MAKPQSNSERGNMRPKVLLTCILAAVVALGGASCRSADSESEERLPVKAPQTRIHPGAKAAKLVEVPADIDRGLQELADGIVKGDASLIFGIFSDKRPTTYTRDDHIYESVKEAEEQYAKGFKEYPPKGREFVYVEKQYDILDAENIQFTGVGVIYEAEKKPWKIVYTILWSHEAAGWKALNMHISWK